MNLHSIPFPIYSLMLLSSIFLNQHSYAIKEVKITNGEWPPFLSEKLEHYGVGSRIVTEAFRKSGYQVQYGFFPWDKALDLARTGVWQGSIAWTRNESREKYFYYSDPVFEADEVFFHLKEKPFEWKEWQDLRNLNIGATGGYYYGEDFKTAEEGGLINVIRSGSDIRTFKKLLDTQVDLAVNNEYVGWFLLQTHFTAQEVARVAHHPRKVRSGSWHLLMSKASPHHEQLIKQFNVGLRQLNEETDIEAWLEEAKQYSTKEIRTAASPQKTP